MALLLCMITGALALSSLPPQSERSQVTQSTADGLAPALQSNTFILTTATTQWAAPGFSPTAIPCSSVVCPAMGGKTCVDSSGSSFGVICDQRISGVAITSSGKHKERGVDSKLQETDYQEDLEGRSYTGSIDLCATFCDQFDQQYCVGFGYASGICTLYAAIQGTIQQPGSIAFVRQA